MGCCCSSRNVPEDKDNFKSSDPVSDEAMIVPELTQDAYASLPPPPLRPQDHVTPETAPQAYAASSVKSDRFSAASSQKPFSTGAHVTASSVSSYAASHKTTSHAGDTTAPTTLAEHPASRRVRPLGHAIEQEQAPTGTPGTTAESGRHLSFSSYAPYSAVSRIGYGKHLQRPSIVQWAENTTHAHPDDGTPHPPSAPYSPLARSTGPHGSTSHQEDHAAARAYIKSHAIAPSRSALHEEAFAEQTYTDVPLPASYVKSHAILPSEPPAFEPHYDEQTYTDIPLPATYVKSHAILPSSAEPHETSDRPEVPLPATYNKSHSVLPSQPNVHHEIYEQTYTDVPLPASYVKSHAVMPSAQPDPEPSQGPSNPFGQPADSRNRSHSLPPHLWYQQQTNPFIEPHQRNRIQSMTAPSTRPIPSPAPSNGTTFTDMYLHNQKFLDGNSLDHRVTVAR